MRETLPPVTSADPATDYARAVACGDLMAGPHVRAACARHLRDIEHGEARGLVWDTQAADRAIGFFRDILRLNGGEYEGVAYELLPWQAFIVGSLAGWKGQDGFRRFRVAYIETAKGSGKSPLAAGIGLYGLTADGESRAEIYAAATKKDQAQILFRDAVAMVDQSPALSARIEKSGATGREWNLAYHSSGSFFRPISSDDGQSGPRPHIALLDEIHEHKDNNVVEMVRAGTKSRRQALIFMITNSGISRTSVAWEYHDYACKVSADMVQDDSFFGYVCALDPEDDPFSDESCWPKANPSLPYGLPGERYIREQVVQARGMPSKESVIRRLNFCQWVESASPWIGSEVWLAAGRDYTAEQIAGRRAWGGLDLSATQDLTAFVLWVEPARAGEPWHMLAWAWLPETGLADKAAQDRVPYTLWKARGYLETTEGRAIDKLTVASRVASICAAFSVQEIAFDRWRMKEFVTAADSEGIGLPALVEHGQGYKDMSPAIEEFERHLLNGLVVHPNSPVMTWCAANAVCTRDDAGNRKFSKEKATGRIDLIVAAAMACSRAVAGGGMGESVYEQMARSQAAA
jgi:phage terminase large subunit-like protein